MMSDFTCVEITFDPYNHDRVQKFTRDVTNEFGRDKSRWYWRPRDIVDFDNPLVWTVNFYFRDPVDATFFSIKYGQGRIT